MFLLLLGCVLVSCTLPNAFAMDLIEISQEDEPVEVTKETQENPTELKKLPKLPTLDGLAVNENGEYFNWNSGSNISGYQVRIAGLDRVRRTIVDYNNKVKADTPYFLLPRLNEGEYFLLVRAESNNEEYLSSDWAVMEYRIGVEASDGIFEECHNNWSGFYRIFESTEDTEGLEARYCLTCLKTQVLRNAVLPSGDQWMIFTLINGGTEYSVRAHSIYSELPYEEAIIPAYFKGKPVTQIETLGFYRMLKLKTVAIPNTVNKIGDGAFANCSNLQTIYFDEGNAYYKFDGGCLIEIETNKIISGTNDSVIPNYITDIGSCAFYALKMTSVFIPASVKEVGSNAFNGCNELISVVFEEGSQLERISVGMFGGCISLKDIVLPNNLKIIDEFAFGSCISIESLIIPINCTYIGAFTFEGWGSSQTIYITAFSSQAEADNAFDLCWNISDRNGVNPSPKLIFLG
jgi:hypothetical protein